MQRASRCFQVWQWMLNPWAAKHFQSHLCSRSPLCHSTVHVPKRKFRKKLPSRKQVSKYLMDIHVHQTQVAMASQKWLASGWSCCLPCGRHRLTQMGSWEMSDFHKDLLSSGWQLSRAPVLPTVMLEVKLMTLGVEVHSEPPQDVLVSCSHPVLGKYRALLSSFFFLLKAAWHF